jgi:hypothetical protein
MRAAKKGFRVGFSLEPHAAVPPSVAPPSPVPNPALVPVQPWVHFIMNPIMGWVATGKWSQMSVATEGDGTILWQHDWGPFQPHKIIPAPVVETPSTLMLLLGSSAKYYLPSFSVKQPADGAINTGSATPVAICFPAYCIVLETCADISTKGFNIPLPGICLQSMTTRWVGFASGDFWAGIIGVVGDCAASLVLSHFGGKLFSGMSDNQLFGALGGSFANVVGGLVTNWPLLVGALGFSPVVLGAMHAEGLSTNTAQGLGGILIAPVIAWAFGLAATSVGDASGSKPADAQPGWEQAPPDAEPPPSPATAAAAPSSTGAPPAPSTDGGAGGGPDAGTTPADGGAGGAPDAGAGSPTSSSSANQSTSDDSGGVCEPPPPRL